MTEKMKALSDHLVALWNEGNFGLASEVYAENVTYHQYTLPEPLKGREAAVQFVKKIKAAFPDFKLKLEETVEEGNKVFARWSWTGTHKGEWRGIAPTEKTVNQMGVTILHVENGKIVELFDIADSYHVLRQLGAVPEVATAAVR
jgi:steroid delta-isomerase-like uncharacterized protein